MITVSKIQAAKRNYFASRSQRGNSAHGKGRHEMWLMALIPVFAADLPGRSGWFKKLRGLRPAFRWAGACALWLALLAANSSVHAEPVTPTPAGVTSGENQPAWTAASIEAIPWSQIGAAAQQQYQGDGLAILPEPQGAMLRCVFQRLEAQATEEGLWLTSTVPHAAPATFRVVAAALARQPSTSAVAADIHRLPPIGTVEATPRLVRFIRPGLIEEYSVSMDGVRQDFLILARPGGAGELRLELDVTGARVHPAHFGGRLVLAERTIAYSRLHVEDATGRTLPARIEATYGMAILVDDTEAVYPIRIDPTFSDENWISMGGSLAGTDASVRTAVVDGAGNLYIGGYFTLVGEAFASHVAKWDGSSWSALGSGVNDTVKALAVSGGDLYVGGNFTSAGGVSGRNRIAKWAIGGQDDSSWSALGSGVDNYVRALAVSGNDLYVGGWFRSAGGISGRNQIAKWAIGGADDSSWSALGSGVDGWVEALAVSGSDLYVGGWFRAAGSVSGLNRIAKWAIGGSNDGSWSALGSGVNSAVKALAVSGNDLFVGGDFTSAGGVPARNHIAKWNGSSWSGLGAGVNGWVGALAVSGSDLYVGGEFTSAGGKPARNIARWVVSGADDSSWSALDSGVDGWIEALSVSGDHLYVGGSFTSAGGVAGRNRIAQWSIGGQNDSSWSALGSGSSVNDHVYALAVSGSDLYVAGVFLSLGAGIPANRIAKWDGSNWSALGSGLGGGLLPYVSALAVSGGNLYVGGRFTSAGGVSGRHGIAKWAIGGTDDSSWSALGSGVNGWVEALKASGTDLYAGGSFTSAGSKPAGNIAKWAIGGADDSSWSALGSGVNSSVKALAVSGTDLYAGGVFSSAGGKPANNVAKWAIGGSNDGSWSALGSGVNDDVYALAVSGGDLFVGGAFTSAGAGIQANHIAKWDGGNWSALGSGVNNTVEALAVSGSYLFVGGWFTTAGGIPANRIAQWSMGGQNDSSWSALGSGVNDNVYALAATGSDLYVGGNFTSAGGKASVFLAKARVQSLYPAEFVPEEIALVQEGLRLTFRVRAGGRYRIEASSNLIVWTFLENLEAGANAGNDIVLMSFIDTEAHEFQYRFYRIAAE
jgi:hypothetical protein